MFIKSIFRSKFGDDVLWNMGSVAVLGICGILMHTIIGRFYGAATLGVFNQVYSFFILFSQFAVLGLHNSTLKHLAQFSDDHGTRGDIILSAIVITFLVGGLASGLLFLLKDSVGKLLQSPDVATGLFYVIPGLWFFALNKVLLSVLNGLRLMKIYAVAQAMRYILIVSALVALMIYKAPGSVLPMVFSISELILLIVLSVYVFGKGLCPKKLRSLNLRNYWAKKHISFGLRAMPSGAFRDINTRVDVLILGLFTTDRLVGIYSFAAILAEGVIQVIKVLRTNLNPIITRMFYREGRLKLETTIKRGVKLFYPVAIIGGTIGILIFPLFVNTFFGDTGFIESRNIFIILMVGIIASAGYRPFDMLFVQVGYPGIYSIMIFLTVTVNVILNSIFIWQWGIIGAAIATSISFVFSVIFLKIMARKKLGISI